MIQLRKYQENAIKTLREKIKNGLKRLILCSPTGSGKTIMFTYMVTRAIKNSKRVLIVTDRIELLRQAGGALEGFGLFPAEIKAGKKLKDFNQPLYVGMVQTLMRRVKDEKYRHFISGKDLIILDEAHKQSFNFLMPLISKKTVVIGATATPHRESSQSSLNEFYEEIVDVCQINDLVRDGFLSSPENYGVPIDLSGIRTVRGDYDSREMGERYNELKLYHGVYENYIRLTLGKKALIFAPSVASSKELVFDFILKGLPIRHLDAKTPRGERHEILEWFDNTPGAMLSNVGILNAGYDCPSVEVIILYRATKSLPLFLQMCGRGSRVTATKKQFTILDFGCNTKRHGFWQQDRTWSLRRPEKKQGEAPIKECPECFYLLPASLMECPKCGHVFEKTDDEKEQERIVELEQLSYQEIKNEVRTADFKRLHEIQQAKGYKRQWVYYQLKTVEDLEKYAKWMGYHPKWVNYQISQRQRSNRSA